MSKRILQKIATQTRTVSYKFNDQFLFDSIPICSLSMTEAKGNLRKILSKNFTLNHQKIQDNILFFIFLNIFLVAFDIMKTGDFISTASLIKLFGRKGVVMESGIKRFVRERTGKRKC